MEQFPSTHVKLSTESLTFPLVTPINVYPPPGSYNLNTSSYHIFNPDNSSSSWLFGQWLQETHTIVLTSPENREGPFPRDHKYTIKADT
jgi:hypothetical protein